MDNKDIEHIKTVAIRMHQEFKQNYNIIIINPVNGKFDQEKSYYDIVDDSYYLRNRPLTKHLYNTKDLIKNKK